MATKVILDESGGWVLFDPAALASMLDRYPDPPRAFAALPRVLASEVRRANAMCLDGAGGERKVEVEVRKRKSSSIGFL